jgi:hypothetical protein
MRAPAAARAADLLVFVLFLAVPLAASRALWDQFTTVKWYVLEVLAAAWLVAETGAGGAGWPSFLRRHRAWVLLLALLSVASALRMGIGAAVGPLVERGTFVALTLCAFWSQRREGAAVRAARAGTALALAVVTALGWWQAVGPDPLAALNAGDHRGSTFGNANMAAQYVGLSIVLLLATPWPRRRWRVGVEAAVLAASGAWLVVLATRSVLLALGAAVLAWALLLHRRRREVLWALAGAAVLAIAWWTGTRLLSAEARARKATSAEHRLAVWSDTVRLIADHPLGVGAGRFEDVFRSYQATGATSADERIVFRQPHNEPLRIAAEEGLPFVAVLAVLLLKLARALRPAFRAGPATDARHRLVVGWGVFLAVESFFQFPFAMAFGALATAAGLGSCLGLADEAGAPRRPVSWAGRAAAAAAATVLIVGAARLAWSERLFVGRRTDLAAQERACRLDPRNIPACVMEAWLRGSHGDLAGGRARAAEVLRRAPHYPPAIKLLAQEALASGDVEAGCVYLFTYDRLFRGQSTLSGELARSCDERARQAAARRVPSPHYDRFPFAGADARERAPR